jgi:intracellular septation protein A
VGVAATDDLSDFVRDAVNRGASRDEIRAVLLGAGWAEAQVASAIAGFADVDFPVAVPRPRPSLSAREAFEYLVLFGTLYFSAFALGRLLFQFINLAFPDPLWPDFRFTAITEAIRWSISSLVVSTPVFLFVAWSNKRKIEASPVMRGSTVRRWLTYVTLAVAASLLIGDCTSLVYNLLGGEMTMRFFLKAATIGAIAGTAFVYYLSDLRRDERELGT